MADRQQRYDPRMGDESEDEQERPYPADSSPVPTPSHHHADRHVRLDAKPTTFDERPPDENADIERADSSPSNDTHVTQVMKEGELRKGEDEDGQQASTKSTRFLRRVQITAGKVVQKLPFKPDLSWVSNNWTWSKIKPVIRCAAVAWISILFVIIPKLEVMLGQVSSIVFIYALTLTHR